MCCACTAVSTLLLCHIYMVPIKIHKTASLQLQYIWYNVLLYMFFILTAKSNGKPRLKMRSQQFCTLCKRAGRDKRVNYRLVSVGMSRYFADQELPQLQYTWCSYICQNLTWIGACKHTSTGTFVLLSPHPWAMVACTSRTSRKE